mgnify:CR=1 FL=1
MNMRIRRATERDLEIIKSWASVGRLEERTCRPVKNGRHVPSSGKVVRLAYFVDGQKNPVGKFDVFDFNTRNRSAEFGIMIDPECRGLGHGRQMVADCLDYLFATTNLNKLYGQTGEFNQAAVGLLKKLGFHRDAVLRQHHELDGRLYDDYVFSILREEWLSRKKVKRK